MIKLVLGSMRLTIRNIRNQNTHTELTHRKILTRFTHKRMLIMMKIILTKSTLFTTVDIDIITHIHITTKMSILQTLMMAAIESIELAQ